MSSLPPTTLLKTLDRTEKSLAKIHERFFQIICFLFLKFLTKFKFHSIFIPSQTSAQRFPSRVPETYLARTAARVAGLSARGPNQTKAANSCSCCNPSAYGLLADAEQQFSSALSDDDGFRDYKSGERGFKLFGFHNWHTLWWSFQLQVR